MASLRGRALPRAGSLFLSILLAVVCQLPSSNANFFTRIFRPPCPIQRSPPFKGFLRWSDKRTWQLLGSRAVSRGGSSSNFIPGVGAGQGVNVTIPCRVSVLLDVPKIKLTVLTVQGLLQVDDRTVSPKHFLLQASFIVVQGRLVAGSARKSLGRKLVFQLVPNPINRQPLTVSAPSSPNARTASAYPDTADIGHKAFAVVGGQVDFSGMPGGWNTPPFSKLAATVRPGQRFVRVRSKDGLVRRWPKGGSIAVASTSFFGSETEERTITGYGRSGNGVVTLIVDRPFQYEHFGDARGLKDGFGGYVDEVAEVVLNTRNIVITGTDERSPYNLEGGHFIVFQTQTPQFIRGVEFALMGQQGQLGRYPLHFHVCGETHGKSVIGRNAIHHSKQRCVVVHATHSLSIKYTVAYHVIGHCFLIEEGGERGNRFIRNVALLSFSPQLLVTEGATDNIPAMYWVTNLMNDYIGNVGAASATSGLWFQTPYSVQGMSANIPELAGIQPIFTNGGKFVGNVFHSNGVFGIQMYFFGVKGHDNNQRVLDRFRIYKNPLGVQMKGSSWLVLQRSVISDNILGVIDSSNKGGLIVSCLFVGRTRLLQRKQIPTGPFNFISGSPGHNTVTGIFGLLTTAWGPTIDVPAARYMNLRFSGFSPTFLPTGAMSVFTGEPGTSSWYPGTGIQNFQVAKGSIPVWFPKNKDLPSGSTLRQATESFILTDADGSLTRSRGKVASLVADSPALLPPQPKSSCIPLPNANAWLCPGLCYHSVQVQYQEPGASSNSFSHIELVRVENGQRMALGTDPGVGFSSEGMRTFQFSASSKGTYALHIRPPKGVKAFTPSSITISLNTLDPIVRHCYDPLTLAVMPPAKHGWQWEVLPTTAVYWQKNMNAFYSPCPGVTSALPNGSDFWVERYTYACVRKQQALILRWYPTTSYLPVLTLRPTTKWGPATCSNRAAKQCGVVTTTSVFEVDTSGRNLNPPLATVPFYSLDFPESWNWHNGMLGFYQISPAIFGGKSLLTSKVFRPSNVNTFYIRKKFSLSSLHCYTAVNVDYLPIFGLAVYLNGRALFRFNLPTGPLLQSTLSSKSLPPLQRLEYATRTLSLPKTLLRNGQNLVAFEVHAIAGVSDLYFGARLSLTSRC